MITENEFISMQKKKSTRKAYKTALNRFQDIMNIKLPELIKMQPDDIIKTLNQFILKLYNKTPKTQALYFQVIKVFLKYNNIQLNEFHLKHISKSIKDKKSATTFKFLNKKQLKKILQHANLKDKALFMLLATSGLRVNEALQLKINNFDFNSDPTLISVPYNITKNGYKRTTFTTQETKEILLQWIDYRPKYLKERANKIRNPKLKNIKTNKELIFPYAYRSAYIMWNKLIKKAGFDQKDNTTNWHQYKIHGLRAYFRSQIATEISQDIIDMLMGHETALTQAYRNLTDEELKEQYKKTENKLKIFESMEDLTEIREQIEAIKKENQELKEKYKQLAKDQYNKLHPYPNTNMDYYEIKEIKILDDSELFIDINKDTYETYIITDENRIKALKEYYKDIIKDARKNKAKSIITS